MKKRNKIVYIDMDDTLFAYTAAKEEALHLDLTQPYPQSVKGFFEGLMPLDGAIQAYKWLKDQGYDVKFLTAPSVYNPMSYMEKRISIEKWFGFTACKDLIICDDKSLVKGDYLIDNNEASNKQNEFEGELIHFGSARFPDWNAVVNYIPAKELQ